ncbi:DUF4245 domain-containing protein [Phytohabitans rumicis]|uniref:DUF4245 domain-containing protein n=1 Tax=Phytohabitans rumicis TaxID=1076125 RepID=A0A6V8L228_9ACTN|nr:DUF4245 domain-containing protein [Phytohabitans rumicis]GFJ91342.1 hypothetical protein Prum_049840 [Phytohabitans rumicis]
MDQQTVAPPPSTNTRRPRDMVLSMAVLLVPVLIIVLIYRVVQGGDQPVKVDTAPALDQARSVGAFPVSEPSGLDDGWRPISATFQTADGGKVLRIGYVTPSGAGVQLVQSDVPAERLLPAELTGSGQPRGATDIAGQSWQRYTARPGEQALVLLQPDRTVIVVGSAEETELRILATAVT